MSARTPHAGWQHWRQTRDAHRFFKACDIPILPRPGLPLDDVAGLGADLAEIHRVRPGDRVRSVYRQRRDKMVLSITRRPRDREHSPVRRRAKATAARSSARSGDSGDPDPPGPSAGRPHARGVAG